MRSRQSNWLRIPHTATADEYAGVASAEALKLALETIYIQTTFQGYKRQAQLEKVRTLQERFGGRWGESGSVAELFGKAYQSVRDFEGAIHWYERAVAASDGTASMVAAEQLANVRVRLAGERVVNALAKRDSMAVRLKKVAGGNRAEDRKARAAAKRALAEAEGELRGSIKSARAPIKEAMVLLDKLVAVQSTRERENMYGSAWKRLAMVEAAASRRTESH